MKPITTFFVILFLIFEPLQARQEWHTCGTHPDRGREELALHRRSMRNRAVKLARLAEAQPLSTNRDIGDIAILEDSDGVVARRNSFNLERKTLRFTPASIEAKRYSFSVSEGGWDEAVAANGRPLSGLEDDDTREMALPFAFPFYGKSYMKMNVNSDGNITFGGGDTSFGDRSLGRVTSGLPRIAGFFRDLNPEPTNGGVRVSSLGASVVVSWVNVPEYVPFGSGPPNSFQIRLYSDGKIEIAFQGIASSSGVTGIAPGNLEGSSAVVSFAAGSSLDYSGAIVERFTNLEEIDTVLAAQKFFETHDDSYDFLVIYNTLGIASGPGSVAFEVTVRNNRLGIGDILVDDGKEYGSARRLQAMMNLGPLSQYPTDPDAVVPARSLSRDTPLTILGHEAGHLFLAFASVREPGNPTALPMLGRQGAHWSFVFNSEASLLEGNRIRDDGPAASQRFTTVATVEGYAPLDQYLMGLRAPEEVPPTFFVNNPTVGPSNRQPQSGISFNGDRRDVSIDELIQAEGRRVPDHTVAQRRFRMGFILVAAQGTDVTAADLAKLDAYRRRFEGFYHQASGQRSHLDTSLKGGLHLSLSPAAGVLVGGTVNAKVSVAKPVAAPLAVILTRQSGALDAPAAVTIPAGQSEVSFAVRGLRAGVEELSAEASGGAYAPGYARAQVLDGLNQLKLTAVTGDKQAAISGTLLPKPVVIGVMDRNNLPYPGLEVSAAVTPGGTVQPAVAVSDADGLVRFQWTPGPGQLHELRAAITGSPAGALLVTALGKPVLETAGVLHAATFRSGLSPGSLATLFGLNLAGGATAVGAAPWQTQLGGVSVLINDVPAGLLYVSDRQINLQVPSELSGTQAVVVVEYGFPSAVQRTSPVTVPLRLLDPGVFVIDPATQLGAVLLAGTGATTSQRPAAAGQVVEIYCTGLGPLRASSSFPGLLETVNLPAVFMAGVQTNVTFSGQAPGIPGLYQINARVPAGLGAGAQTLQIRMDGVAGNEVKLVLR
ncbi:MAG: hypothetical protein JJE04_27730 [Acidobacteriia bacterium]|nr:hypothetical protein [Terriglobia bacterium]